MITIAVDAMGGDNAPDAVLAGCRSAIFAFSNLHILLCGPVTDLRYKLLPVEAEQAEPGTLADIDTAAVGSSHITLIDAPDIISNHEHPVVAVRRKSKSSLVTAVDLVKNKKAHACVSAGSTGALLAGGIFRIGCIPGIERPALAPLIPTRKGLSMLIDAGANVDCKPEYLVQFGLMGAVYMERVMGRSPAKVGLINIGEEPEKGNDLVKKAHALMLKQPYNFVGNVEARDIPLGEADVLVADGFSGNVALKLMEGLASTMFSMLKEDVSKGGPISMIGGALLKPTLRKFKRRMDADETGGAVFLGVNGGVIKAHGSASPRAFHQAISVAISMVEGEVVAHIGEGVSSLQL